MTPHSKSRSIALLLFNIGARLGWVVNATPRSNYPREKDTVPILREVVYVPGPVWTGAENHAVTEIRSPDRPARSQSGLQYVPLKTLAYICKTIQTVQ
jgi:hypothetical protein